MKQLIEGIELLGKTKDSGYNNPHYLILTPHKQYIQLSELLYQTVSAMKQATSEEEVAAYVSKIHHKVIDSRAVHFLIDTKLAPLGIIKQYGPIVRHPKHTNIAHAPDMLHGLKYRMTILPEKAVSYIADLYLPLFDPRVVWVVLVCIVAMNVWVFGFHGINNSLQQTLLDPVLFLLIFGLIIFSSLFHEIGHAAGAMYGGSKPGRIGSGLYLIWPAFFTDITDVYRLGRNARLRSDLGGVYFNLVFSLIIGIVYFLTGFEPLLLLIAIQNLAVFHQLMPFLRLDGYFIVSDLVGVPDLFMRIGPIIQSVFLRKKTNATKDLKTWVKWVVTIWVLITFPLLGLILGWMILTAPVIITSAIMSAQMHTQAMIISYNNQDYLVTLVGGLQLFILMLPALGVSMILFMLGKVLFNKLNTKMDSYINVPQFDKRPYQPYHYDNGSY